MKKVVQDLTSGGLLGVWGKWVKHTKYIYNIQDFNPEQVLAVGYTKSKFITDAMMWFDKFSCKRSDLVITVGRDLVETVENRFKGKKVPKTVMINNWIDENEIYPLDESNERVVAFKKKYGLDGKFVIMYSGNIGLYYDLENLIKVVEKFKAGTKTADGREVVFAFVGAGSVLDKLVLYVKEHHMDNVTFIPYQDKADLIYSLNAGDNVGISGATIYARKKITIGENTCIGGNCKILDNDFHPIEAEARNKLLRDENGGDSDLVPSREIKIGKNCFIGCNSIILKGTVLGDGCVVGAGAVVAGKFEDNCVIAGNPARVIKRL